MPPVMPRTILDSGMNSNARKHARDATARSLHCSSRRPSDAAGKNYTIPNLPGHARVQIEWSLCINPVCDPGSLADRLRFVRAFLCDPLHVGAIAPASSSLGDRIGAATRKAARDGFRNGAERGIGMHARPRIVELGAGTGSVSRFISAMNPVLVERNGEWAALLRRALPVSRDSCRVRDARARQPREARRASFRRFRMLNNPQADAIRQVADAQVSRRVDPILRPLYLRLEQSAGRRRIPRREARIFRHAEPPARIGVGVSLRRGSRERALRTLRLTAGASSR